MLSLKQCGINLQGKFPKISTVYIVPEQTSCFR